MGLGSVVLGSIILPLLLAPTSFMTLGKPLKLLCLNFPIGKRTSPMQSCYRIK